MTLMTEKDKKLLYLLTVVVILFVFLNYLIIPQIHTAGQLDQKLEEAQFQRLQMQQRILSMSGKQQEIHQQKEQLQLAISDYYPILTSQEIDSELTGLLLKNQLTALELQIRMPQEPVRLSPYRQTENEEADPAENMENTTELWQAEVYAAELEATAQGREEDCLALLEELSEQYPAIRITACSFQKLFEAENAENSGKTREETLQRIRLEMELYMYRIEE